MKIKAIKSFVGMTDGQLASYVDGETYEVPDKVGKQFAAEGLAEAVVPKKAKAKKE